MPAAAVRRRRPKAPKLTRHAQLDGFVREKLQARWSPQQISRHLRKQFPDDARMWLCHESIYQAVYRPSSGLLRPSPLARAVVPVVRRR